MDDVSSRAANLLVGNSPGTESLEIMISGPELLFHVPAVVAVCGAKMSEVTVDGQAQPMWSRFIIQGGQKLKIGKVEGVGCRCYLAVKGGFPEVAVYLGSKASSPSLNLGGTQGRQLQKGDLIALSEETSKWTASAEPYSLPPEAIPRFDFDNILCLHGPHDSDDFMTAEDRELLYTTSWKIGHNTNRTGIRLIGPRPKWARSDGGLGGGHPSNGKCPINPSGSTFRLTVFQFSSMDTLDSASTGRVTPPLCLLTILPILVASSAPQQYALVNRTNSDNSSLEIS